MPSKASCSGVALLPRLETLSLAIPFECTASPLILETELERDIVRGIFAAREALRSAIEGFAECIRAW